jgi:hypothetical protein
LSKYVDSSLPYGEDVSLEDLSKLTPVSIIEDTDPGTSTFNSIQGFSFIQYISLHELLGRTTNNQVIFECFPIK